MTIDFLVKSYKKWGEDNDIKNLGSDDEMLFWDSNLSEDQEQSLEKFIQLWDMVETPINLRKEQNES